MTVTFKPTQISGLSTHSCGSSNDASFNDLASMIGGVVVSVNDVPAIVIETARVQHDVLQTVKGEFPLHSGVWAAYEPQSGVKVFHANAGRCYCVNRRGLRYADPSWALDFGNRILDRLGIKRKLYWYSDWRRALDKPVERRAAETFIAAQRLAAAGLGPPVYGLVIIRAFTGNPRGAAGPTAGIVVGNANTLPPKPEATDEDCTAAGVTVDRLRSCVRQQINGYVTDLNSVVGVMPVDAEQDIDSLVKNIRDFL
jgi:hypothetical protein